MLCQNYKRLQWQSKLSARLYNVPYTHTTFTLPKELRGLAKRNPREIYSLLFRSAWQCIKKIGKSLDVEMGMIGVLHTWGSDMKYHVHIHCLITFGGLDKQGDWVWPKHKNRLSRYRTINKYYKEFFLAGLSKLFASNQIKYHKNYKELELLLTGKQWVVNNSWPIANTAIIEAYLSKYINRSAVSAKRLSYDAISGNVYLSHKDYKAQKKGEASVYKIAKIKPLIAIGKILQHKLPPSYHRVRYYGLHHGVKEKQVKTKLNPALKRNKSSIQILFMLLNAMHKQGIAKKICKSCGCDSFNKVKVAGDSGWVYQNVVDYSPNKSPPIRIPQVLGKKI